MSEEGEEQIRVRMPKKGEIFGVVVAMVGGSRMKVMCADGKERLARIPGRMKRVAWIKEGDVVLLVPWEIDNSRADITWRYTRIQVKYLKEKGVIPKTLPLD